MKAKMFNYSKWINTTDERYLKQYFTDLLTASKFDIVSFQDKKFDGYGYTALWLLSESHFAVHTFPEHNKTYIELSSCIKLQYKQFKKKIDII